VRQVRVHEDKVAGFQLAWLTVENAFALARQNLNQRFLGGGVLGEFLAFGKTEQHNSHGGSSQQSAAHNPIFCELRLRGQRHGPGATRIDKRSFIHIRKVARRHRWHFDVNQEMRVSPISGSAAFNAASLPKWRGPRSAIRAPTA